MPAGLILESYTAGPITESRILVFSCLVGRNSKQVVNFIKNLRPNLGISILAYNIVMKGHYYAVVALHFVKNLQCGIILF